MSSLLKVDEIALYSAAGVTVSSALTASSTLAVTGVSTFSAALRAADGSAATPAYSFTSGTTTGLYWNGTNVLLAVVGGTDSGAFHANGIWLPVDAHYYGWGSALDLKLYRDAANTLAQRNGTTAQAFRLYNTYTDASNYERLAVKFSANQVQVLMEQGGTGTMRVIRIGQASGPIFGIGHSTDNWNLSTSAHLVTGTDNTYDIGASGATRPRSGYFGTSVYTPLVGTNAASYLSFTTTGGIQLVVAHTASAVNYWNFTGASTGNDVLVQANGSDSNIGIQYYTKGTSGHRFFTNLLSEQFRIAHTASADRYIQITGSNGGNPTITTSAGNLAITPAVVLASSLTVATGFGCNGTAAQTAVASGGALNAYSTGVFGLNSDANMSAMHALVVAMRAALVANGIMS